MRRFPDSRHGLRKAFVAAILPCALGGKIVAWGQGSAVVPAVSSAPAGGGVSLVDYQARLKSLDQLLAGCQQSMIPANCQSDRVGADLRLALPSGARPIRFAWVRDLLDRAAKEGPAHQDAGKQDLRKQGESKNGSKTEPADLKSAKTQKAEDADAEKSDSPESKNPDDSEDDDPAAVKPEVQFQEPNLTQQLAEARKRLGEEAFLAATLAAQPASQPNTKPGQANAGASDNSAQRQALTRILAGKEFHAAVASPSLVDRVIEKVGNWIDRFLGKLAEAGFKSKWIGYSAEIGFVLLLCIGLVWFLIRLEKQGRMGMANIRLGAGADAASARDWQLWLRDARSAAAQGAWRDAIHLLYWASISRLESSGQWPADRARTPREYLALLSPESAQRTELDRLTRSFERTWYAGRAAEESDFRAAEQVASKLGIAPEAQ